MLLFAPLVAAFAGGHNTAVLKPSELAVACSTSGPHARSSTSIRAWSWSKVPCPRPRPMLAQEGGT